VRIFSGFIRLDSPNRGTRALCHLTFNRNGFRLKTLKHFAAILLLFVFLGLGTGALQYLHELQHAAEDARYNQLAKVAGLPPVHQNHDESNCEFCAQLHIPLMLAGWTPILICLGLFVAFLTLVELPLVAFAVPARIDCRGPPACMSSF
jgi:hypothetical protein